MSSNDELARKRQELRQYWQDIKQEEDLVLLELFKSKQSQIARDIYAPPETFVNEQRCNWTAANADTLAKAPLAGSPQHRFNNTRDDLASNYLPTLIHWFAAAIESDLTTQKQPYTWFLPDDHQDTAAPDFPARIDLSTGEYIASESDLKGDDDAVYTIGVVSDWSSGTQDSYQVAQHVWNQHNHYNVHLGDTCFTGTKSDCLQNFCGIDVDRTGKIPIQFPWGETGALAIPGNHENYSHLVGFRQVIMPFCGPNRASEQQAPFWSLETPHWIVIGIDTAYNCFDILKWNAKDNTEAANPSMLLAEPIVKWLQSQLKADDNRGIILLTHHIPMSVIDTEPVFQQLTDQIAAIFDKRTIIWLFGHEHFLMVWKPASWTAATGTAAFKFYGRCIGMGGFPVETQGVHLQSINTGVKKYKEHVEMYDTTPGLDSRYGRNGWCRISLHGPKATLDYFMLKYINSSEAEAIKIATEQFSVKLDGSISSIALAGRSSMEQPKGRHTALGDTFIPAIRRQSNPSNCCCTVM